MKYALLQASLLLCSCPQDSLGFLDVIKHRAAHQGTQFGIGGKASFLNIKTSVQEASGPVVTRKQRLTALIETITALNASGVNVVTAYGTTLGLVREGDLLEWDDDVDFIVDDETFHLVRPALEKLRMDMWVRLCAGDMYRAQADKWGPIDIYRVSTGDPQRKQSSNESDLLCEWQDEVLIPRSQIFPPKWVSPKHIPGLTVPLPNMPEDHLEHFYGADWRTPNSKYKGPWNGNGPGRTRPVMKQYHRLCGFKPYRPIPGMEYLEQPAPLDESAASTSRAGILPESMLATGLMIPLLIAAWLVWKGKTLASYWSNPSSFGMYELTIAVLYISLSASATLCLRQTQGSELEVTIEACLLLYVLKALLSFGLLSFKQSMSFGEICEVLQQKAGDMYLPVWGNLAVIGCLFACYDTLSFLASQRLPPMSFQLLLNSRTLLIVPLQWRLLGKRINMIQFSALLLIAFAACSLGSADIFSLDPRRDAKLKRDYLIGILGVGGKVLLSGLALVVNEKMLKELPLTVDAQNLLTYTFSMVFLGIGMIFRSFRMVRQDPLQMDVAVVWGQIFNNAWMVSSVLLMAILGIVCAYLLKVFSAMEKEFMACGVVALLAIGQTLTPGEHGVTLLSIESGLIILLGCVAYRLNDLPPESKTEQK